MKPKQETLEEAAKKYKDLKLPDDLYDGFIAGAKWQAKRMYSKEEVLDLLAGFVDSRGKDFIPFKDIQRWFERFKKK